MSIYDNCRELEARLCAYTGAPFCVVVDNNCNGIFLALRYLINADYIHAGDHVYIPNHTYVGVPYAIKAAGLKVFFRNSDEYLVGEYQILGTPVIDSALRLTYGMFRPGAFQVLSFTGPFKHLRCQKGGAILTDNQDAAEWLRRARFSGRGEMSYHDDTFTLPEGYNFYMPAMLATLALQMIDGLPKENPDLIMKYPDLSKHPAFK
jgi:dTDP-4-amino-4,6-dideoxygalactose transaminase